MITGIMMASRFIAKFNLLIVNLLPFRFTIVQQSVFLKKDFFPLSSARKKLNECGSKRFRLRVVFTLSGLLHRVQYWGVCNSSSQCLCSSEGISHP